MPSRNRRRRQRSPVARATGPFVLRNIPYFEILNEEGLALIEQNADILLEEIGIEFRDFPKALDLFKNAGADIDGQCVHFPRGFCREIIQSHAPSEYIQHARNPANNVIIGGRRTVLVPAYGPPFVRDLDKGRRYGTIEDFRNFVKLAYMSPNLITRAELYVNQLIYLSISVTLT